MLKGWGTHRHWEGRRRGLRSHTAKTLALAEGIQPAQWSWVRLRSQRDGGGLASAIEALQTRDVATYERLFDFVGVLEASTTTQSRAI